MIVEDDAAFARTLVRSFERRGYQVRHLAGEDGMPTLLEDFAPTHAVVDLKLAAGASGLSSVKHLHAFDADMVIIVLTGYASIATAVEATKLGAHHYLAKPSNDVDSLLLTIPLIRQKSYEIAKLTPVGNYALTPEWTDGHTSGIYTWQYLYDMGRDLNEALKKRDEALYKPLDG